MPLLTQNRRLLEDFRANSRPALDEVFFHYAPGLTEFLRSGFAFESREKTCVFKGFAAPFDLENAIQEVFLRAFSERARLSYDGLRPYVNYLYAIARNYVIDELRRRSATLELFAEIEDAPRDAINSELTCSGCDPSFHVEEREIERLLSEFLQSRDDLTQSYYHWRYEETLTQSAVGHKLGLTRIQIRRIEARFKRELLSYFKDNGYLGFLGSSPRKHGWAMLGLLLALGMW
jgi:RNA polymerase sigma factor (sigma-70 family)